MVIFRGYCIGLATTWVMTFRHYYETTYVCGKRYDDCPLAFLLQGSVVTWRNGVGLGLVESHDVMDVFPF